MAAINKQLATLILLALTVVAFTIPVSAADGTGGTSDVSNVSTATASSTASAESLQSIMQDGKVGCDMNDLMIAFSSATVSGTNINFGLRGIAFANASSVVIFNLGTTNFPFNLLGVNRMLSLDLTAFNNQVVSVNTIATADARSVFNNVFGSNARAFARVSVLAQNEFITAFQINELCLVDLNGVVTTVPLTSPLFGFINFNDGSFIITVSSEAQAGLQSLATSIASSATTVAVDRAIKIEPTTAPTTGLASTPTCTPTPTSTP